MDKFSIKKLNKWGKVLSLFALMLILTFGISKVNAHADQTSADASGLYLITVTTTATAGTDSVEAFRIHYKTGHTGGFDPNRQEDTYVVFPKIENGMSLEKIGKMTGGTVDASHPGLEANSTNYYLVKFAGSIENITGVDVVMTGKGNWGCAGLKIAELDTINSVKLLASGNAAHGVKSSGTVIVKANIGTASDGMPQKMYRSNGVPQIIKMDVDFVNEPYSDVEEDPELYFRIDVADTYKAGVESQEPFTMYESAISNMKHLLHEVDTVYAVVSYLDKDGIARIVKYPIMSSAIDYAIQEGNVNPDVSIMGILEQGQTAMFKMTVPDYKDILEVTILYDKAETAIQGDALNVAGISVYDVKKTEVSVKAENGLLRYNVVGYPNYYFKASDHIGASVQPGNRISMKIGDSSGVYHLVKYQEGDMILPVDNRELYMFEINTNSVSGSAATGDAMIAINYTTADGQEKTTDEFSLVDVIQDYYGYWNSSPSIVYASDDENRMTSFYFCTAEGETVRFYVNIDRVETIDSIDVRLKDIDDTWQISTVNVLRINHKGHRIAKIGTVYPNTTSFDPKISSIFTLDRDIYGTSNTIASNTESVYIHNGTTVNIPFTVKKESEKKKDPGYDRDQKYASYEEICRNWGFTMARSNYTVTVAVADDALTDYNNGDPGSENYFYFQLLFENGEKSPIVLANQQIEGDAFRTGDLATFTISSNRDHGDVKKVRIIPDDTSTKSEIFDKLKIKYVKVEQESGTGVNRTWTFNYNDWIDINYYDDAQTSAGRTIEEMAVDLERTSVSYGMNLEVAVSTSTLPKDKKQFVGEMKGRIGYIDGTGQQTYYPFNVTENMFIYNEQTKIVKNQKIESNPAYMFRPGYTDRFEIPIDNCKRLTDIEFELYCADDNMDWTVEGVSVFLVTDEGNLSLNMNQEFEKTSDKKYLCSALIDEPQSVPRLTKLTMQNIKFDFSQNEISIVDDEVIIHTRRPDSLNDNLAMYVQLSDDADSAFVKPYTMQAIVKYKTVNGKDMTSVVTLTPGDSGKGFYRADINASSINSITSVTLLASGNEVVNAAVSDISILQTRKDTETGSRKIVKQYFIEMGNANAYTKGGITGEPGAANPHRGHQDVYIGFGSDVPLQGLLQGLNDVYVSFSYESLADPYGQKLQSSFVSLASLGVQEIASGKMVVVPFDVGLIGRITGVQIKESGNLSNVFVDSIRVVSYEGNESKQNIKEIASIFKNQEVIGLPVTWDFTEEGGVVTPVQMTFNTSSTAEGGNDLSAPVRLTVGYRDDQGELKVRIYDDIAQLMDKYKTFEQGTSNTINFMIPSNGAIEYIEVEPYDENEEYIVSWKLDSIEMSTMQEDKFTKPSVWPVNDFIFEEEPYRIELQRSFVYAEVVPTDKDGKSTDAIRFTGSGNKAPIFVEGNSTLSMHMVFNNKDIEYKISVKELSSSDKNAAEMNAPEGLLEKVADQDDYYIFKVPEEKQVDQYYAIVISEASTDNVYEKIHVTVRAAGSKLTPSDNDDSDKETESSENEETEAEETTTAPAPSEDTPNSEEPTGSSDNGETEAPAPEAEAPENP